MAKTKLFTITIDNHPGALAHIAKTLGDADVNILALLGTAQGASGAIQLVADSPARARKALDGVRVHYQESAAEEIELANKPGALAECLEKLSAKGVNLNSIHASASKSGKKAILVYTVETAAAKAASATA